MPKVILIGTPQTQWNIGQGTKESRFEPGGTILELTEAEINKHKDVILERLDKPKKEPKIYTKEELFDLNKTEQIKILKKLSITKIPRYEKDRVNAILEAQK